MTGESAASGSPAPRASAKFKLPHQPIADQPDLQQARLWAEALLGSQGTEWRLLSPGLPPKALYGALAEVEPDLLAPNAEGYQVYAVVNQVPQYRLRELREAGRGFTSKLDVAEVRAVFADLDSHEDAAERIASAPLPPSIVVRSSSQHKLHAYWLTRDLAPAEFSSYQRAIATLLGSDPAVVDLPRIMRVPGFVHRKDGRDAVRSELLLADPERVYSTAELREAFGVETEAEDLGRTLQQSVTPDLAPSAVELVVEALKHPDLAKLENRHECMKAALNLGARSRRLQDMVRYLQSDEIRLAWVKDGNVRSHSEWLSEIDRWVVAETAQGSYGIKTLTDNGFPIPDLPRREVSGPVGRTRILRIADLLALPNPRWLVRDLLMEDTVAMVYGPPAAGKSFMVMDLAMRMATGGERWAGRRIQPGGVVYLVGEGQQSIGKRTRAWCQFHGEGAGGDLPSGLVVALNAGPLSIAEPDAALAVIAEAVTMLREDGHQPKLVVVDTVSRHMTGDENAAADAKRFVAAADQVRREYGVTVLLVHHTGKKVELGARGSSVFKGDVDTLLEVEGAGDSPTLSLRPDKQKDADGSLPAIRFRKEVVELGVDDDGEPVTSLALVFDPSSPVAPVVALDETQLAIVQLVAELGRNESGDFVGVSNQRLWAAVSERGIYRSNDTFKTAMRRLADGYGGREGLRVLEKRERTWFVRDWTVLPRDEPDPGDHAEAKPQEDPESAPPNWERTVTITPIG